MIRHSFKNKKYTYIFIYIIFLCFSYIYFIVIFQEFQFKQSNISQILDAFSSIPTACSLLVTDKKRGLLYIGQNNKIIMLKPGEDNDPEWKVEFNIPVAVSKLTLNCDCSYLAVAAHGSIILIYDAQALTKNVCLNQYRILFFFFDIFIKEFYNHMSFSRTYNYYIKLKFPHQMEIYL